MNFIIRGLNQGNVSNRIASVPQRRNLWSWINMMFNNVDESRLKEVGPEIACAEWLLRNGATLRWTNSDGFIADYNSLSSKKSTRTIEDIDGTNSSISHYGFPHLKGCPHVKKIILDHCTYIDDKAMKGLTNVSSPLKYLQISNCVNVTDNGLLDIPILDQLENLVLFNLPSVKDIKKCEDIISKRMPKCDIDIY